MKHISCQNRPSLICYESEYAALDKIKRLIMMGQMFASAKQTAIQQWLLVMGILFVSFNLRPAITAVGPLVSEIRADLGMTNWMAGLLTTLPLLAFTVFSPFAPAVGRKLGNEIAILLGMGLLAAGIFVRSAGGLMMLFSGTVLVGMGIAIANVLLPGIIKLKFPEKASLMTGVYTTSLGIFAALASGISVPLSADLGWGWKKTLLAWVILACLAFFIWLPHIWREKNEKGKIVMVKSRGNLFRSGLAWQVTLFMGMQSFVFYSLITWVPEILYSHGFSRTASGWMLSVLQFAGLPASFIVPVVAGKMKSQKSIVLVIGSTLFIGFLGLLAGGSHGVMMMWILLLGLGQGAGFSMAMTFFVLRARNVMDAARLSGMAQSLGYLMSAFGPMIIGLEFDHTHDWTWPILTLIGVVSVMMLAGTGAGRNVYVR
jgi:CP family cyanate transporter-like MFS transporter